ncbi:hypothetical protein FB550_102438 [Neobacillus bataviensis]|uniref:Uncharacterized protein n=1 Tax=Neobacillus bataviensis TaxID=220685 RepID=A0A561DST8_9BACI|nr:hypothetical protein [Neobacillus bataviensis]TWE06416.1 hypothetical protein FB550_102438 [Neobacillus bataviensis]
MARKKEEKIDYVRMFREEWKNKYNDEMLKGKNEEQLKAILEELEDGLAEARKKQEEYNSIGVSWTKLADNVLIIFEYSDETRIKERILEQKRKLGFLLDDEEKVMREKMTPYQLESLKETREKVKNGVEYRCTYHKEGGATCSIGTPNKEVLAKFISKFSQEKGLGSLRSETQVGLFFDSLKSK